MIVFIALEIKATKKRKKIKSIGELTLETQRELTNWLWARAKGSDKASEIEYAYIIYITLPFVVVGGVVPMFPFKIII